jgi:hypothetical protein
MAGPFWFSSGRTKFDTLPVCKLFEREVMERLQKDD